MKRSVGSSGLSVIVKGKLYSLSEISNSFCKPLGSMFKVTVCVPAIVAHHQSVIAMVSPLLMLGILPSFGYVSDFSPAASIIKCRSLATASPLLTTLNLISRIEPATASFAGRLPSIISIEPWNDSAGAASILSMV